MKLAIALAAAAGIALGDPCCERGWDPPRRGRWSRRGRRDPSASRTMTGPPWSNVKASRASTPGSSRRSGRSPAQDHHQGTRTSAADL